MVSKRWGRVLPDQNVAGRSARSTVSDAAVVAAKLRVPPAAALRRGRLEERLAGIWSHRLGVVIAPAGSGKTTLLAGFAAASNASVAWYRADAWDADESVLLRNLEATLTTALPGLAGAWTSVSAAAAALDRWHEGRALLVIDDFHALEGTPAEQTVGRLIGYAPSWLAIVIGSRIAPGLNLPRLRVAGELLEIAPDDLRFRAWEVEQLFRDHYGHQVPPDDLASLARRTEGWAAGLQLFHLATRDKSAADQRRILSASGSGGRLLREYLTWNVMADLPEELREFLVGTCVLGRLTGPLCDRLLDRSGSAAMLEELFRRRLFTVEVDAADGSYRYHEVLRSHLDRMLVERIGEAAARERFRSAAVLLEGSGAGAEALAAFARAEDWDAVRGLLGGQGEHLAGERSDWLDGLPLAIIRHEPWLELAAARRARSEGRWRDALDAYERAEAGFGVSRIADVCHDERQALRVWLEPAPTLPPNADWVRTLRAGLARRPLALMRDMDPPDGVPPSFIRGILALAAGEVLTARRELTSAQVLLDGRPALATITAIGIGLARLLAGDRGGIADLDRAEDMAERMRSPWLARLARAGARLGAPPAGPNQPHPEGWQVDPGDPWGAAFAALLEAWQPGSDDGRDGPGPAVRRSSAAERAATGFRELGSAVMEAWAEALFALGQAEQGAGDALERALAADTLARTAGVPGARLIALRALLRTDPTRLAEDEIVSAIALQTGLIGPPLGETPEQRGAARPARSAAPDQPDQIEIRLFGGFEMTRAGRLVHLETIKPRARALLRLLASRSGVGVHREVIGAALWPDAETGAAARSLQVAISAVRGLLVSELGPVGSNLLRRHGDAYRLEIPSAAIDIRRFDQRLAEARAARGRGGSPVPALTSALALYVGDLLPEDGPEEWIVDLRDQYRTQAVEAAQEAAEAALLGDDVRTAIDCCRTGLTIDRYHDPLWRLLIEARRRAGDLSAADRDRREYASMLVELGLEPTPVVSGS